MKISPQVKNIAKVIALVLAIGVAVYLNSSATMTMGDFSGNGR